MEGTKAKPYRRYPPCRRRGGPPGKSNFLSVQLYWTGRRLDAGIAWLNTNVMSKIEAPSGANKNSGLGREDGIVGLKEHLKLKNNVLLVGAEYDNFYAFDT